MKFGKTIETNAKELPDEWQPYLIQYKLLKKSIKQIVQELDATFKRLNIAPLADPDASLQADHTHADTVTSDIEPSAIAGNDKEQLGASKSAAGEYAGVLEEVAYNIEKDNNGLVHPVITVKLRRPASNQQDRGNGDLSAASLPESTPIILQPSHISDKLIGENPSTSSETAAAVVVPLNPSQHDSAPISNASNSAGVSITNANGPDLRANVCDIATEMTMGKDAEETQVIVRLEADQLFFDQLVQYIERMRQFEQKYTKAYNANVDHIGDELATITSPYKHDYQVWREIFRLYMDSEIWSHSQGDCRSTSSAREGQERFGKFVKHIEAIRLVQRLRDPMSARLLMSFYKLNMELAHMKLLQEMNEEATRKIIKKHDKRTHLVAKKQFPQLVTIDTASLTQALIFTIYNDLVGVVPQIDDYLCPMCLNIAWRPLRLECAHLFCSRCIVKASRRHMFDCPICRSKNAVYNAGVNNIDKALLNFLKLYFPEDIKAKQREIQQDISEEESRAIVAAQDRNSPCIIM
ncbi:hypothetical protein COEREDRAFT_82746 [Coemansia reversa NRRL 1564]|uniref:SPX-domain-containing protein n=1 Tax=Coemansia reversa (strain ATCC 12441 / NRRL 1564) TaxID=763665 RepID=A0A2G5B628_COERN|nr:hypothetical protein COEREDRAFT_82746 [Coemansia reversa NRRL 1564]|eukprot:PIA14476.1 hypothetical protein COEREDRAFT_82746 [Coemansia reversa NRRL 1564]